MITKGEVQQRTGIKGAIYTQFLNIHIKILPLKRIPKILSLCKCTLKIYLCFQLFLLFLHRGGCKGTQIFIYNHHEHKCICLDSLSNGFFHPFQQWLFFQEMKCLAHNKYQSISGHYFIFIQNISICLHEAQKTDMTIKRCWIHGINNTSIAKTNHVCKGNLKHYFLCKRMYVCVVDQEIFGENMKGQQHCFLTFTLFSLTYSVRNMIQYIHQKHWVLSLHGMNVATLSITLKLNSVVALKRVLHLLIIVLIWTELTKGEKIT